MDIKKLQAVVVDALEDVKAHDIKVFDTMHLTSMFDRLAVASGTSNRQTKALAASVRDKVKEKGGDIISIEGEETGEWVLVDLGDMVVHIMQPAIRDYYRLEEIWGDKEVKLGAAKRKSAKAAMDAAEEATEPKKRSRATVSSRATQASLDDDDTPKKPARKAPAKKAAAKTPRVPSGGVVKVGARKSAAPKKAAAKTTAAPKPAAKRAPRKTASKTAE
ncbi:ribosome silencing factor [Noviherbaspirillum galbum]|uniref:Ribosomal silencing factor RsfS n=1 Tax=Noviherbaspirillum galbum TaxID=2709383 RepID=A0A6B3STP1_9BURK|nr:ribosome silencing factor [Noviherbaspirillum galbum]NEX64370.1 ribosome silencing factor [Noviherbaspirillum galbum]